MELHKLKELRLEKGMSCQEVASKIGVTKSYYWMIERGDRRLTYELAVNIASVFQLQPDDIFLTSKST